MTQKTKGQATREHVVQTALEMINTRGFSKSSISDIIEATGVKKGNLYFHFSSKDELGMAIIDEAARQYNEYLKERITGDTFVDKLFSLMEAVFRYHRQRRFIGGCIFGNTALEMSDVNPEFAERISEIFLEWKAMISSLIRKAMDRGELSPGTEPDSLAAHIIAVLEGGIMLSRVSKDENDMRRCLDSLRAFINSQRV